MINSKKKGFTIVELVIVIAVIAILSAVLIPTFSNLVRKAQEAADLQLAKNLNTALSMAEAEGEEIAEFSDVLEVLHKEGYVISNLNPTAKDNWYAWDQKTNQILYLDSEFNIIYSVREASAKSDWIIGVGTSADRDTVKNAGMTPFFAPNNTEDLNDYIEEVLNSNSSDPQTIIFSGNIDFDNSPIYNISQGQKNLTFDLAGSTLGGTIVHEVAPLFISQGIFTLKNGTFTAEGKHIADDGSGRVLSSSVQLGKSSEKNAENSLLTVDNMVFDTQATAIRVYYGNAEIKNTSMNIVGGQSVYAGAGSNITISNVVSNVKNWENIFASSYGSAGNETATVTIENSTFNVTNGDGSVSGNLNVHNGASIIIKNGVFNSYDSNNEYDHDIMFDIVSGEIKIYGGTFNGYSFESLSAEDWKMFTNDNINVSISDDGKCVTLSK